MNRVAVLLWVAVMAGGLAGSFGATVPAGAQEVEKATADPWCRLDDPGTSEQERRRLKLGARELASKLVCPSPVNPQQRPDELILPMPCGRAMVFRKVAFPLRSVLDHRKVYLGVVPEGESDPTAQPPRAVVSGPREAFIAGSLSMAPLASGDQAALQRGYYIGKYEVTALQFEIYKHGLLTVEGINPTPSSPVCQPIVAAAAKASGTLVLPATQVTWFDAVDFARAYTEWLIALDRASIAAKHGATVLPWEEASPSFLRLPTAAEWEYAARGGDAAAATQSQRIHDVVVDGERRPGRLDEVASLTEPQSPPPDGAEVHYIGRKLPNLLDLYDMIGNAAEIVLDLFQPRRPDQLQGLMGSFMVMGGSATDSGPAVGVGARAEVPFFKKDGPVRSPTTGFRLVVASPFLVSKRLPDWNETLGNPNLDAAINRAYSMLTDTNATPGGNERAAADQQLQRFQDDLRKQTEDLEKQKADTGSWRKLTDRLQAELQAVRTNLDSSNAAINEREAQIRVEQFRSIILSASNINAVDRGNRASEMAFKRAKSEGTSVEELRMYANMREQLRRANDSNFRYYVETVRMLSQSSSDDIRLTAEQANHQFLTESANVFDNFHALALKHIETARQTHGNISEAMKKTWEDEIKKASRTTAKSINIHSKERH